MRAGEVVDYSDVFSGSWDEFLDLLEDYEVLEYDHDLGVAISVAVGDDTFQVPYGEYEEWLDDYEQSRDDRREIDYWANQ